VNNRWVAVATSLLLAIPIALFFLFFESYEETEDDDWSDATITNPYLAAQQYLIKAGANTQTGYSLQELLPLDQIDTLFISDQGNLISDSQIDTLMAWVKAGGNLIISGSMKDWEADSEMLLPWLNVEIYETDCGCGHYGYYDDETATDFGNEENTPTETSEDESAETSDDEYSSASSDANDDATSAPVEFNAENTPSTMQTAEDLDKERVLDPTLKTVLTFDEDESEVVVSFDPAYAIYHPYLDAEDDESYEGLKPFYWQGSDWGIHFMQFEIGDGLITVMSDPEVWNNYWVDQYDHAYLLTTLTWNAKNVRFIIGSQMPSLFTLAWRHGSEFLIAASLFIMAWLIYRGRRFLPPVNVVSTERRSFGEHIDAIGHYHWQAKDAQFLISTLRAEIHSRASVTILGYPNLDPTNQCRKLAEHSQIDATMVTTAMQEKELYGETVFTDAIKTLQNIRSKLSHSKRY